MIRCASCGAAHPANTLFCDECGFRLTAAPATATPLPAQAQAASRSEPSLPESSGATPLLVKLESRDTETRYECMLQTELVIGRADHGGKQPDIDLTGLRGIEQGVSRRHARIVRAGDDAALEDLSSLNGTFIGGHRLTPGRPEVIRPGDELQFGKIVLVVSR